MFRDTTPVLYTNTIQCSIPKRTNCIHDNSNLALRNYAKNRKYLQTKRNPRQVLRSSLSATFPIARSLHQLTLAPLKTLVKRVLYKVEMCNH